MFPLETRFFCILSNMEQEIQHVEKGSKGYFFIKGEGNKRLAEMTYSIASEELIIIDHTEVSDELRGTGTGKKLVKAAVEMARKSDTQIIPLCPFAKAVIDKTPEFQDVLKQ